MSHNEYRDQMTYDATKEEETICEDCGVKNDESFSYYMNRCSDCCYKRDERNREYDKEKAEEEEFICDQKEKCSNDLSCIGCYSQEEEVDANGNSNSDYKKAEKECPIGYIVVWNRWEKGFKYRKLDKDGYMEQLEFD